MFSDVFRRLFAFLVLDDPDRETDTGNKSNTAVKLTQVKSSGKVMISYNWKSGGKIAQKVLFKQISILYLQRNGTVYHGFVCNTKPLCVVLNYFKDFHMKAKRPKVFSFFVKRCMSPVTNCIALSFL